MAELEFKPSSAWLLPRAHGPCITPLCSHPDMCGPRTVGRTRSTTSEGLLGDKNDETKLYAEK